MSSLIIDNAGFDVEAMSALTEADFIELHKSNPAIQYGKTEQDLLKWLKNAHKAICEKAGVKSETKKQKVPPVSD